MCFFHVSWLGNGGYIYIDPTVGKNSKKMDAAFSLSWATVQLSSRSRWRSPPYSMYLGAFVEVNGSCQKKKKINGHIMSIP